MIRKLHKDDLEKAARIWLEVNTETHYFIREAYWREQLDAVKEILPRSEVYVYEKKDYIKGIKRDLSLHVYQKNQRAVDFYQRENFTVESETVDENTGAQEFVMVWGSRGNPGI